MYRTKKELDLHVEDTFSKVRGEHERATRCFNIAKQYASIKEFNSAIRYMEKYLTTNPSNAAEALKLIGDYYRESNSFDKALESYKSSYKARKTRETLTKICDLLEAGHGSKEDQGVGRQRWFELQRVAPNLSDSPLPYHNTNSANFTNRPSVNSGPPRTGFSKTLMASSNISMNSPKSNSHIQSSPHEVSFSLGPKAFASSPEREENPIRSLERRYDDTLAKILGTVQRIADDLNVLKERVEEISLTQENLVESRAQSRKDEEAKSVNGNRDGENVNSVPPIVQPQQLPLMQPNPAFGYGVPFPSPYMHPFFMPDPTLSYLNNNPMLAAAALYGNPMFGNPLAAGGIPRNETQQPTAIPPNPTETSLLAGLLTKNQFMSSSAANAQIGDGLYPQNQLIQAQLAASANLGDKLWQAPQLVPTSVAMEPIFSATGTSTSNANTSVINSSENSKNGPITSTPLKTPTNLSALKTEIAETPKSSSPSVSTAKKEVKGLNLFPENVVVSNTEKVPTVSSSAFNSNVLSVTIPPEHRNAGTANNNTNSNASSLPAVNTSMTMRESKTIKQSHNFQISAPVFKPREPKFDETKVEEAANPFSNISLAAPSFGDLAKSAASTGFTGFQSVNVFSGTGTPVFGNVIASQSAAGDAVVRQDRVEGDEVTDEFVPTAEFQPVIPLPPLVEVKKGNENENTLFEHRAKIYKFVKETKEWKERGVGNIMILQDKDNPRKIRVVMWRERVFKLACNHLITKDLVIENHQGSSKILKWTVMDFAEADSEPKLEIFTCRFGQEEKCAEFKATMERMIAFLATQDDSSLDQQPKEKETPVIKPFADLFKKPAGSWSCRACYVDNDEKHTACVSCGTHKETQGQSVETSDKSLAELFKAPEGSWTCGGCYISNGKDVNECVACNTPKSTTTSVSIAKKEVEGLNQFPENVVVSNAEKAPTVSSSAFNSNILSATIQPEHRNSGTNINNTKTPVFKPWEPKLDEIKVEEPANPFSNISFVAPSFGDLAKSAASTGFTGFQSVNVFNGTGTPVFGNLNASQSTAGDAVVRQDTVDGDEVTEDFVPTAEFQPVIPLPPLVEVKKGNENENTLFEHRAKIYRFVKETKEWKERGVGNIMILQDKDNPRKIRVVMWRERVFKLACNHLITKDLVIENHQGSSKILKWTVMDFAEADSEPKLEIFTCRFGQEDKCAEFKATMERMIAFLATQEDSSLDQQPKEKEAPVIKPFADIFKKPAGSWNCEACYVNNSEKNTNCVSCDTPKESSKDKDKKTENNLGNVENPPTVSSTTPFSSNIFNVNIPPEENQNTSFSSNNSSTISLGTFTFSSGENKSIPTFSAPIFKPQEPQSEEKKTQDEAVNPFSGISFAAPSFGDLAKNATNQGFAGFATVNSFSGAGMPVFGSVTTTQPAVDGEEVAEEFVPTAEFQPVIPLPPLVEVKKGNENENTLFEHRAKVYRFVKETKEWKERGVGNIMILQDKDNPRKIRVVMWRERVFKLACNHLITKDLVIENHQGSSKILKWTVMDFAEADSEPKLEIFTCRFGQEDKCAEFKATMERMIAFLATQEDSSLDLQPKEKEAPVIKPFADIFKKPAGSWSCQSCYVDNDEKHTECVSCGTPKETQGQPVETSDKSLAELFKAPEGSWTCGGCYISNGKEVSACVACNTPKPGSQPDVAPVILDDPPKFTFGFPSAPIVETPSEENCPGCRGCDPDSFDFSQLNNRILPPQPKDPIQKIVKTPENTDEK